MYNLLKNQKQAGNVAAPSTNKKKTKGLSLRAKRFIGYSLIVLSIVLFVGYFFMYVPVSRTYAQAMVLSDHLRVLSMHGKDQNIIGVQEELPKTRQELENLKGSRGRLDQVGTIFWKLLS
jgi:hypothetical protein